MHNTAADARSTKEHAPALTEDEGRKWPVGALWEKEEDSA
jgi:hypothetical protein